MLNVCPLSLELLIDFCTAIWPPRKQRVGLQR